MAAGGTGDLDQFVDRSLEPVTFVAHVRDVPAARFRGGLRQRDQLGRLGEKSRRIDQRTADTQRAFAHRLSHEVLHAGQFGRRRITVVFAEHVHAHAGRANEGRDVKRNASAHERIEILAERGPVDLVLDVALVLEDVCLHRVVERAAGLTLAHDLERDPLLEVAHAAAVSDQRRVGPRQHVDETRRDGLAARVDLGRRPGAGEVTDRGDTIATNANIRSPTRRAGAIEERAVADDEVVSVGRLRRRRCRRRGSRRAGTGCEQCCADKDGRERRAMPGVHRDFPTVGRQRTDSCGRAAR